MIDIDDQILLDDECILEYSQDIMEVGDIELKQTGQQKQNEIKAVLLQIL